VIVTYQDQDTALIQVQSEIEADLKAILGFKGLTWPQEARLGRGAGQVPTP
jgi:hypothetical protein